MQFHQSDFAQLQQAQEDRFRVQLDAGSGSSFRADLVGSSEAASFLPMSMSDTPPMAAASVDFAGLAAGEATWPTGAHNGLWLGDASQLVAPPVAAAAANNEFGGAAASGAMAMDSGDGASAGISRDLLQQLLTAGLDMASLQAMLAALEGSAALPSSTALEPQPSHVAVDSAAQLLAAAGAPADYAMAGISAAFPPANAYPLLGSRANLGHSHGLADGRSALPPVSPHVNARSRPQPVTGERPVTVLGSAPSPSLPGSAEQQSLRSRRGLPDLPSSLASARPSGGVSRLAAATGLPISPSPPAGGSFPHNTGKREAEGGMTGAAFRWPLSPALKSPRSDGYGSPGGRRVVSAAAASPTALAGDMAQLRVRSLPTTPLGMAAPPPLGSGRGAGGVRSAESSRGTHSRGSSGEQGCEVASGVLGAVGDGEQEGAGRDVRDRGMEGLGGYAEDGAAGRAGDGMDGGIGGEELSGGDGFGLDEGGEEDAEGEGGRGGGRGRGRQSTKPRSVAERMRRERISVRLKRLKEVMPRTEARTDTAAMLEDAVVYIRSLQLRCSALERQNAVLASQVSDVARGSGRTNPQ